MLPCYQTLSGCQVQVLCIPQDIAVQHRVLCLPELHLLLLRRQLIFLASYVSALIRRGLVNALCDMSRKFGD